ncbi:hypothetical protein GCM10027346_43300 [Hymenobacter seoulensis]
MSVVDLPVVSGLILSLNLKDSFEVIAGLAFIFGIRWVWYLLFDSTVVKHPRTGATYRMPKTVDSKVDQWHQKEDFKKWLEEQDRK